MSCPDFELEDTLFLPFTTRAFATGIPTALAAGVIDIYEDVTATPIITTETLTVSLNSKVGFNMITVTATAASGFEIGKHYTALLNAGTVGGVSVANEVAYEFTIGKSAAAKDLANVTDGLTVLKAETAAILLDTTEIGAAGAGLTAINLPNQTMDIVGNITGNLSGSVGSVTGHTPQTGDTFVLANGPTGFNAIAAFLDTEIAAILVDTGTTIPALIAALNDPTAAAIADAVWDEAQADHVAAGTFGIIASEIASILIDTDEIGTAGAGLTNINLPNQTMDIVGNITGNLSGSVGSVTGNVGGTINGLTVAALADFFNVDSGETFGSSVAGSVVKEIVDNAGGSSLTEAGIADAVWNEAQADHVAAGTFGIIASEIASILIDTDEIGTAGAGLTNINLPNQTMDIVGNITGNLSGSVGSVTGNVGGTINGLTVAALADFFNVDSGETFGTSVGGSVVKEIVDNAGGSSLTEAGIADAVWNEAQADHVAAGTFGIIASEIASILLDTDEIGTAGAGLTNINLPNQTMDIVGNITGNLSGSVGSLTGHTPQTGDTFVLANGSTGFNALKAETAAILVDTDTTIPALIAGLNDPSAAVIADAVWNEAQADHVAAGTFGIIASEIASILSDTMAILVDTDTTIPGLISALNDPTAAAIADLVWDTLQSAHTTVGSFGELATEIGAILVDTDTTIPALINGLNDPTAAAIAIAVGTTQIVESYAANTVVPTRDQAMMAIHQMLMQFVVASTNIAVNKVDDTLAFNVTIDDDTNPTSAKRL